MTDAEPDTLFFERLAMCRYYNMDQVVRPGAGDMAQTGNENAEPELTPVRA